MHSLPKVETRKQFMDTLSDMITPPKSEDGEGGEMRGRPTELKSYLLESNATLSSNFQFDEVQADVSDTGVESIKVLTMVRKGKMVQFYLDLSDERFPLLHTNHHSEDTHDFVHRLIQSDKNEFDSAWLSTTMLKEMASKTGNRDEGYSVDYEDIFQSVGEEDIIPRNDVRLDISGTLSKNFLKVIKQDENIQRTMGYEKIRIARGLPRKGVLDDVSYDGRFRVVRGKSVDDHMILVDGVKAEYSRKVRQIEEERIFGTRDKSEGSLSIEGHPFDFTFSRSVEDWAKFLPRMFDAKSPFRIWGIKTKIDNDFYRVLGVDMHTGHPLDIEITNGLIRVYLPKGSCGNVVLRLFANLQRYFDSTMQCHQIN
jgi:hypothetical protein